MPPLTQFIDQAMLDRIAVYVIEMPREVVFVAYDMLPESGLPYGFDIRALHVMLDETPARGEIRIILRQCPDRVKVVR